MMDKFVVFLLCLCLTIGGVVHLYDSISDGIKYAPHWLNIYWRILGLLYFLTVFLLIRYRRVGLVVMLVVLLTNVAFNSHAHYALEILNNEAVLQMKTLFLGFAIGVSIWLWSMQQYRQPRQIFR